MDSFFLRQPDWTRPMASSNFGFLLNFIFMHLLPKLDSMQSYYMQYFFFRSKRTVGSFLLLNLSILNRMAFCPLLVPCILKLKIKLLQNSFLYFCCKFHQAIRKVNNSDIVAKLFKICVSPFKGSRRWVGSKINFWIFGVKVLVWFM